ncbi:hypothetical protein AX16_000010 [Volvariella volvacea WC 439]|nr:hypothetical protein AX16_000010 [Volvariella volvacea WC 439]
MSSILSTTRNLWRKSPKPKEHPISDAVNGQPSDGAEPSFDTVTLAVIGCGQRGQAYAHYALRNPDLCKVVAIAEPRPKTQEYFADLHKVDKTLVFSSWEDLLVASTETIKTVGQRLADAVIVAVQDQMHAQVVLAFAKQGYHILCEKPMATRLNDCFEMHRAVKEAGIIFGMGHVMRYSPYVKELTEVIRSGELGELVNIVHVEPIGHFHFAHSYVRGNWSSEQKSSFSLMTKSCHDIDILCHWFNPATPARVSSFGSLHHFRRSAKPQGAGEATKCLDCPMEKECPYSAKRIYLGPVSRGNTGWPVETIVDGLPDIENVTEALKTGPYGKCVYESANDVCDNQVVNIEFSNGTTASFTMVAFTSAICEQETRIHFTHGEIIGDMTRFTVTDFRKSTTRKIIPAYEGGGHGGGDLGLIRAFIKAVGTKDQKWLGTDVDEVLHSHLTVFAAEKRKEGRVIDCQEFEQEMRTSFENGGSNPVDASD